MADPLPSLELSPTVRRFRRLTARGPGAAGTPGCLFALGLPLTLLGSLFASLPFWSGDSLGESWVAMVVGGGFALVGLLLVHGGMRGLRARSLPPPELEIERDRPAAVGGRFAVRVHQPGPVHLELLRLALTCERRYRRPLRANSSATVDDSQLLWEHEALAVRKQPVAAGTRLERVVEIALPADARPTGPAEPDGRIRWTLELTVEAGFLRGWRTDFELEVEGAGEVQRGAAVTGGDNGRSSEPPFVAPKTPNRAER